MSKPNASGSLQAPPLSLSDTSLALVMRLAAPLSPGRRCALLRLLGAALRDRHNLDDGELHRLVRTLIRANRLANRRSF